MLVHKLLGFYFSLYWVFHVPLLKNKDTVTCMSH